MNTDLLRAEKTWADVLQDMRGHLESLRAERISEAAIHTWALHWDHQLYKGIINRLMHTRVSVLVSNIV